MREVLVAERSETVREVARRMVVDRVGTIVVVEQGRRPVGIVTDRDVVGRCVALHRSPDDTPVDAIMTAPLVTVDEATPIEDALSRMAGHGIRRVVVVDAAGDLAGILALDDVLQLFAEEFAALGRIVGRRDEAR